MAAKRAMKASGWRDSGDEWKATPEVLRRVIDEFNKKPKEEQVCALAALEHSPEAANTLRDLIDERRENVRQWDCGVSR